MQAPLLFLFFAVRLCSHAMLWSASAVHRLFKTQTQMHQILKNTSENKNLDSPALQAINTLRLKNIFENTMEKHFMNLQGFF